MYFILVVFLCHTVVGNSFSLTNDESPAFAEDTLQDTHGKIIHSSVLFRHGDRAVETPYPTDPNSAFVWPEGYGQLTKRGRLQGYELGKWFLKRYENSIITNGYMGDAVLVNSSDINRCLMTAEVVLAGLFPPSEEEMWSDDNLKWQPIPVHAVPSEYDYVLQENIPCPRCTFEQTLFLSSEFSAICQKYEDLFLYVGHYFGYEISENLPFTINLLYRNIFIESSYNLTIPSWAKRIYPEPLKSFYIEMLSLAGRTHEIRRLTGGPLLGTIIGDMKRKRSQQFNQTLHLYSVHENAIIHFLSTLAISNSLPPPYCSSVIVELRQKEDAYIVTILYRNSTTRPPHLMKIPGCDDICTLDQFINLTIDLIPENWANECQISTLEKLFRSNFNTIIVFACIVILLISIVICVRLLVLKTNNVKGYGRINRF